MNLNKIIVAACLMAFSSLIPLAPAQATKPPVNGFLREEWVSVPRNIQETRLHELAANGHFNKQAPMSIGFVTQVDEFFSTEQTLAQYTAILTPQKSGKFRFYLAGDDEALLSISPDSDPINLADIATVNHYGKQRDFGPHRASKPIELAAGKSYYLRVLHKQLVGDAHVALAWAIEGEPPALLTGKEISPALDEKKLALLKQAEEKKARCQVLIKEALTSDKDLETYLATIDKKDAELFNQEIEKFASSLRSKPWKEQLLQGKTCRALLARIKFGNGTQVKSKAGKALLVMEENMLKAIPNDDPYLQRPHPMAYALGKIPADSPRQAITTVLSSKANKLSAELVSTGIYVLPGVKTTVVIPQDAALLGLEAQVGHHVPARVQKKALTAMPDTMRIFKLDKSSTTILSPHGGLLLIRVPNKAELKNVRLSANQVIRAAQFVLGRDTNATWKNIRNAPAPWGELVCDNLVLVLPRASLVALDNPQELMTWWNRETGRHHAFYSYVPNAPFRMHVMHHAEEGISYNPLEWEIGNAERVTNLASLQAKHNALFLHEHGHHADSNEIVIGNISESTCNWAGYALRSTTPFEWKDSHEQHIVRLTDPTDKEHQEVKEHGWFDRKDKGTHHWSYMTTGIMIGYAHEFGWDSIQRVIARIMNKDDEMNKWAFTSTNWESQAKLDRYLIGLSQEAKRDVRPYFAHFQMKPSASADEFINKLDLPKWDAAYLIPQAGSVAACPNAKDAPPLLLPVQAGKTLNLTDLQNCIRSLDTEASLFFPKQEIENGELKFEDDGKIVFSAGNKPNTSATILYNIRTQVGTTLPRKITIKITP